MHSMQMTIKETETNLVSSSPEYPTRSSHIISVSSCYLRSLTSIYLQHFSCLKLLNKLLQIVQRKQAPPRTLLVTSHRTQHSHLCRSTTSAAAHNCTYTFPGGHKECTQCGDGWISLHSLACKGSMRGPKALCSCFPACLSGADGRIPCRAGRSWLLLQAVAGTQLLNLQYKAPKLIRKGHYTFKSACIQKGVSERPWQRTYDQRQGFSPSVLLLKLQGQS